MNIFTSVLAVLLLLLALRLVVKRVRKLQAAKQEEAYRRLVEALEAIDQPLQQRFENTTMQDEEALADLKQAVIEAQIKREQVGRQEKTQVAENSELMETVIEAIKQARLTLKKAKDDAKWAEKYQLGEDLSTFEALRARLSDLDYLVFWHHEERAQRLGIDLDALWTELREATYAWFNPRYKQLETDRHAFAELRPLFASDWQGCGDYCISQSPLPTFAKHGISLPADKWNDAVARQLEVPQLDDFHDIHPFRTVGYVLRLAADAIQERSLTMAKIVEAYCLHQEHGSRYTEEVGPLRQELAKMVAKLEKELNLTYY